MYPKRLGLEIFGPTLFCLLHLSVLMFYPHHFSYFYFIRGNQVVNWPHYHELTLHSNTGIIVHQATGTKNFTLTLFFVSSPVMNLPKLLRNRSAELSYEQQKAA